MRYQFDWVDAFTDQPFGGNGCAVVHNAGDLSDAACMAFTRETGLVECTFLEPSKQADMKVRYFMADREIPFAGHPTVASVASMVNRGVASAGELTLETGAGLIPIEIRIENGVPVVSMTQVAPEFGPEMSPDLVAAVGGLNDSDILGTPQVVSTGLPFVVTVLKSREVLEKARMNVQALEALRTEAGGALKDVMEPFWVTLEGATAAGDTYSRLLLAPPLPPEDPFTGSATGAMASYLWANNLIETPTFVAEQGHGLGRPGQAHVELLGPRDAMTGVRVAGPGYVLMQGEVSI